MRWTSLVLALVACGGGGGGNNGGNTELSRFEELINVPSDVNVTGTFSCFTPAADFESTTWLTSTVDPAKQEPLVSINSWVEDFETEDEVYEADVSIWFDDVVEGTADATVRSDIDGELSMEVPPCKAMTYRTSTDPSEDRTEDTYKAHHFYNPPDPGTGEVDAGSFLSVSSTTYQIIPTILGVTVDEDKAVIAGTAYDCSRDPGLPSDDDSGKVEGAQVIVYDENGEIPDALTVNYMTESFPDRDQPYTSEDGLWVAANVPGGNLRIEMWGNIDGELTLLGATSLLSEPGTINIANIFGGYGDGVKYPPACE